VLSGILAEQEKAIIDPLSELGFADAEIARAGEWIALTIHKK
jgi:ribosomal protein L11 methylase PrmA